MSDHIQNTQFPNGVNSPSLTGINTIQCADGLTLLTTPTPINLNVGSQNVGTLSFKIANGNVITGKYNLRVTFGTAVSYINFEVAAQAFSGTPSMSQSITISSVTDIDRTVLQFNTLYLAKNPINNEMAVIAVFNTNSSTSTIASVSCDALGNPAPLSPSMTISTWSVTVSSKIIDSRDGFEVLSQRVNGSSVSLNNIRKPSMVAVNATDSGSKPPGSSGIGTCITTGSGDSVFVTQTFIDSTTGRSYVRYILSDGVTWSAWDNLLKGADVADILNQVSITTMLDAITFG